MSAEGEHTLVGGRLNQALSDAVVRIASRYVGRGPDKATAFYRRNYVVAVMEDAMTVGERNLVVAGCGAPVVELRRQFQVIMQGAAGRPATGRLTSQARVLPTPPMVGSTALHRSGSKHPKGVDMALAVTRRPQRNQQQQQMRRWEPFTEFEQLQDQMQHLLEDIWSGAGPADGGIWSPLVDVEESDDAWIVEAEVPGAKRDDINVEVRDNELAITGEIKERERKGIVRRRTRRTGRFDYRVTLPGHTNAEKMEAKLKDGVLTVRVPKAEEARPRRVEVKSDEK